jgi:ADP-ribose pyrophosphatase YjhB (NUDIX family)
MSKPKYAPREIFEQILEWAVIPTFDLILEYENQGIILVRRKIAPYKNQWALPGLRMFKGESLEDTLTRIGRQELGLDLDLTEKTILGQYVGKFKTEKARQDISTGYHIKIPASQKVSLNEDHFSAMQTITSRDQIPSNIGAMYKFYLTKLFDLKEKS